MVNLRRVIWIVFSSAMLAVGTWLFFHIQITETMRYTGLRGEARNNTLLMLDYLLLEMGQPVRRMDIVRGKVHRLGPQDTLVLYNDRRYLDERTSKQLLDWVRAGGHLVVFGEQSTPGNRTYERKDLILQAVVVTLKRVGGEIDPIEIQNGKSKLSIVLDSEWVVTSPNPSLLHVRNKGAVGCGQYALGRGRITVFADQYTFLTNARLPDNDHGAFAWYLLESPSGTVYYSIFDQDINLFQWLWIKAPYVLITCALIVLFCLWYAVIRQGPILDPVQTPQQRPFLQHFLAAGKYLWRCGRQNELLEPSRRAILRACTRRFPHWQQWDMQEQTQALNALTGIQTMQIHAALFDVPKANPEQFLGMMQTLETLRKTL